MRKCVASWVLAIFVAMSLGAAWPGHAERSDSSPALRIIGIAGNEVSITAAEWAKLPRASVKVVDHGEQATFEGVPARELLKLVGAPLGADLRGQNLSVYVLAEASDGYQVVYTLTEFDTGFTDGLILVADRKNGEALGPKEGPLRMVVPWEKRQARSLRWLTVLRVRMAP